jgi:hypothetical protein
MRRMGSRIALMAAVAVLAVGCSGTPADEPGPVPTGGVPTTPATPTPDPTETEDPFAFDDPSEIDVAYVQRVLDAIYAVVEETIRIEVRAAQAGATEMPREIIDLFATVYGQDKLIFTVESAEEAWSSGRSRPVSRTTRNLRLWSQPTSWMPRSVASSRRSRLTTHHGWPISRSEQCSS